MAGVLFVAADGDSSNFAPGDLLAVDFDDASLPELRSARRRLARLCYYGRFLGE